VLRKSAVWVDTAAYAVNPQEEIWQAIHDRRVSALNADRIQVFFGGFTTDGFKPMGACLNYSPGDAVPVRLYCSVRNPDDSRIGNAFKKVYFYLVVHEVTATTVRHWRVDLSHLPQYYEKINAQLTTLASADTIAYFLVFRQGADTIVTAPIWLREP
jgi:hypothetical protein